jgi:hypothetical protein
MPAEAMIAVRARLWPGPCAGSAPAEIDRHVSQFPAIHTWTEHFLLTLPAGELSYLDYEAT